MIRDDQSIISLCSPQGSGAIAILRLSGKDAITIADKMASFSSNKKLIKSPTHTIHYGKIVSRNVMVDEVMFLLMKGPRTFTGEDTVEITCHNNPFIIEKILREAILNGARRALAGEFSKRAVMNGKIDLLQAEAINEVIAAQTETALKKSMSQLKGTLSSYTLQIEEDITRLLAYVEASFEFLDEEQRDITLDDNISVQHQKLLQKIKNIKDNFSEQKQIREGVRVAIVGCVNAGKSTLFNSILNSERAIVTDIEGTTRDTLEAIVHKNGNFWTIVDTAGLRNTNDFIEQKGIERSFAEAERADIILLTFDAAEKFSKQQEKYYVELSQKYAEKIIIVANKVDFQNTTTFNEKCFSKLISVSAKSKRGIGELIATIDGKVQELFRKLNSPFLLNKRQYGLLLEAEKILSNIDRSSGYELVAHFLKDSLEIIGELTGKNANEKMLNSVFNDFCIGK